MKKHTFLPIAMVLFTLMWMMPVEQTGAIAGNIDETLVTENVVEVYYFHRNRRCGPCRTIENLTVKTMQTYFSAEMEKGDVRFFIVNVEQEDQREIARKFNTASTALYINVKEGDKEEAANLTSFAYRHARNEEAFLAGLKDHIDQGLGK